MGNNTDNIDGVVLEAEERDEDLADLKVAFRSVAPFFYLLFYSIFKDSDNQLFLNHPSFIDLSFFIKTFQELLNGH